MVIHWQEIETYSINDQYSCLFKDDREEVHPQRGGGLPCRDCGSTHLPRVVGCQRGRRLVLGVCAGEGWTRWWLYTTCLVELFVWRQELATYLLTKDRWIRLHHSTHRILYKNWNVPIVGHRFGKSGITARIYQTNRNQECFDVWDGERAAITHVL